jgi:hypothetical protein
VSERERERREIDRYIDIIRESRFKCTSNRKTQLALGNIRILQSRGKYSHSNSKHNTLFMVIILVQAPSGGSVEGKLTSPTTNSTLCN